MFDVTTKSMQWGEDTLTLETGKVARQADGSVIATLGETSVMANVTFAKEQKPDQDFFPLTVHYQDCLLYTSPSPRDRQKSRMPSSA